jgi:hypothetical protein
LPPAGVRDSGGSGKYAIIAILLLLAAGGLFAWRVLGARTSQPPPIASVAPPPLQPPSNPKIDDVPLPPPLEDKPEGGTGPRIIYVRESACEAKCTGTAPPGLDSMINVRGHQARRCYEQALSKDPSLKGHVGFEVRISTSGNVCGVNITSNDLGSAAVANCAAKIFGASGYPAPHGGCIVASTTLSFVPQGSQGGS